MSFHAYVDMYNKQQKFVSYANDEDSDVILLSKGRQTVLVRLDECDFCSAACALDRDSSHKLPALL